MRNTGLIVFGAVLIILLMIAGFFVGTYNKLQVMDENVNSKWAQIDNQLKRRNDLIPNLVATVKGYAAHESSVFTSVANARAALSGALNSKNVKAVGQSSAQLNSALSRLLLIVERYPQLKADRQFMALQDELAGTENRIAVARKDYNESVQQINAAIRTFPTSFVAAITGIKQREYFEIDEANKAVPTVDFSK